MGHHGDWRILPSTPLKGNYWSALKTGLGFKVQASTSVNMQFYDYF
uniref:Uncharacterized protein n=1 Tax=Anguilla anguilla TaxID=7936 RepID=A0A0E9TE44_ANGAN